MVDALHYFEATEVIGSSVVEVTYYPVVEVICYPVVETICYSVVEATHCSAVIGCYRQTIPLTGTSIDTEEK